MKKFGIDISKWQGSFDFNKAIAEGVEFAIIKGGGGDAGLYIDGKFVRNYNEAKSKGLPVGCYWFSRARSVEEALTEAEYFYNNIIKNRQFELPVYIDVEHRDMLAVGKDKLTAIIKAFCKKMEDFGCFVGIYSSKSFFESYMNDMELQAYAHWVAQWNTKCTYEGNENVLGMWQFGGETNLIRTNKVAGVTCDQNYMLLDYPAIIKGAGLNGYEKKSSVTPAGEVKPTDKTLEQLVNEVIRGEWGNGAERKQRLTAAGYNYDEVQSLVNRRYT